MAFTQGQSPDGVTRLRRHVQFHPLHAMLPLRAMPSCHQDGDRILTAKSFMPRLQLIQNIASSMDATHLSAIDLSAFDPQQQVVLETDPTPAPTPFAEKGTATVVDFFPGQLTVEAESSPSGHPLITDAYSNVARPDSLEASTNVYQSCRRITHCKPSRSPPVITASNSNLPAAYQEENGSPLRPSSSSCSQPGIRAEEPPFPVSCETGYESRTNEDPRIGMVGARYGRGCISLITPSFPATCGTRGVCFRTKEIAVAFAQEAQISYCHRRL